MLKWSLTVLLAAVFIVSCTSMNSGPDRGPNAATEEDPWTTWSNLGSGIKDTAKAALILSGIRDDLMSNNLYDPHDRMSKAERDSLNKSYWQHVGLRSADRG